jgi:hypothetical protein
MNTYLNINTIQDGAIPLSKLAEIPSGGNPEANVSAVATSETLDDVNTNTYVKYVAQTLTEEQKAQVKSNIGVESVSSVQPDWNEEDTTSDAYIKNKPGIVYSTGATVIHSTPFYDDDTMGTSIYISNGFISFNIDNKTITFGYGDGTKFLSNDGSYKSIDIPVVVNTTNAQTIDATIKPNTYYVFKYGTQSLNITLEAPTNTEVLNNYMFEFVTSHGTSLTLPSDIKWINDEAPVLELNNTYQVSIINNLATIAKYRYDAPTDL